MRQITDEDKKRLHELIDSGNIVGFNDNEETVESYVNGLTQEIHICKRSGGWQMCFDHNKGEYYQPNRKSLEEFLSEPNTEIKDEYDNVYSFNEFWEMVDRWNADPKNNWVSKTYNQYEKELNPKSEYWNSSFQFYIDKTSVDFYRKQFNVEPEDNDFEVDGLRFSVFTDFC